MSTSADDATCLVDTSVAVALVVEDHSHHAETRRAVAGRHLGLAGHAAFETFSVLTRLPPPARRPPSVVTTILAVNFPDSRFLSPDAAGRLLGRLAGSGIAGGQVYDALVAAAAVEHRLRLFTRDRLAMSTYRAVGAEVELV